ncbi:MAG: hypothetical protein E7416_02670 [Ruminococcaceae bacterium]|nr:hypothetical protein [Oscillospiraceae bacterium]
MLLDKYLIENLDLLGMKIMKKAGLNSTPHNLKQLYCFFETLKNEAEIKNSPSANMIYQILYSFVSSEDVRDRHTSPREFEDIFCSLFGTSCSDDKNRENPKPTDGILKYDIFTIEEDWNISSDLCGNKREKADASINGYNISLKTLKGKNYDEFGKIINRSVNNELNVGSFSFRALFKGILTDAELSKLGDRKSGLGSKKQIRDNVLIPIKQHKKTEAFLQRLKLFLSYVYEEDLVIVIKSNYLTDIYFIPNETFINVLYLLYKEKEDKFEEVWYRWENNNLRINLSKLFEYIKFFQLPYKKITLNLYSFKKIEKINNFNHILSNNIKNEINNLISDI